MNESFGNSADKFDKMVEELLRKQRLRQYAKQQQELGNTSFANVLLTVASNTMRGMRSIMPVSNESNETHVEGTEKTVTLLNNTTTNNDTSQILRALNQPQQLEPTPNVSPKEKPPETAKP